MAIKEFVLKKHLRPLFEDKDRHQVIVAHRRFGKTSYAIQKTILNALEKNNSRYFIILPTYKQAKMVAWSMLNDYIRPLDVVEKSNESEMSLHLKTGSVIELKGSDYPDSLRGVGLDGVVLDEYAIQDPAIFSEIVRPALADRQGWSVKIGTPLGKNHFYDDFVMSGMKHNYPASRTGVINQGELDLARKEMSEDEFMQEFECNFLYHSGQIYKEFKKEVHVIKPRPIKGEYDLSIDYGLRNPTAVGFFVMDYDGNVFLTDEIYEAGKEVEDHAKAIKAIWPNEAAPKGVIDPSTNAKNRVKNGIPYSIFQEFQDNGINLDLAPNQVLGGINLVKQFFSDKRFFIFDRCVNTIKELENYRWKESRSRDANLPEEPLKVNDHACDMIRYYLASKFQRPVRSAERVKENTYEYFAEIRNSLGGKRNVPNYA